MILEMARLRVLGPRERLPEVLATLQDRGILHLVPAGGRFGIEPSRWTASERRAAAAARRAIGEIDAIAADLAGLGLALDTSHAPSAEPAPTLAASVLVVGRTRRAVQRLRDVRQGLEEERAALRAYERLLGGFAPLAGLEGSSAFLVLLRRGGSATARDLERAVARLVGEAYVLETRRLDGGQTGVLLLVARDQASRLEKLLSESRVAQVPVPAALGTPALLEAIPRLRARLDELDRRIEELDASARALVAARGSRLAAASRVLHDAQAALDARGQAGLTAGAFVIEGWLPAREVAALEAELARRLGPELSVETVAREEWRGEEAPVVLRNPRLLRPFEAVVRVLPLPRYGTLDPTPFVAVFLPMFFGLAVGDLGYGACLALLAAALAARSRPGWLGRDVAAIAGSCAAFSIAFGAAYGELFGYLGRRLGLRPLVLDREEAIIPFLLLLLALGAVHLLLGLVLGVVSAVRRDRRLAAGRGVSAAMMALIFVAVLAGVRVLPGGLLTPAAIAALAGLPILVALEGIAAPIELLSTLGRVLSYARVMAVGTASVMLAIVANRMAGLAASAAVGALFALLFHLVNFAITIVSPTIHVLRLHWVEFFGTFYSPGGQPYRPLARWGASPAGRG